MPFTTDAGPAIWYETLGEGANPPIVLISGASAQLIWWRDEFIQRLMDRGLSIVRFDNRDVGLSAKIGGPQDVAPAYTIWDMADDVARVLDAAGLAGAHIVGQSLGGGIAQAAAIRHPDRIRSMTIFYTVPAFDVRYLTDYLKEGVLNATAPGAPVDGAAPSREQIIEDFLDRERNCRSTAYAFDEAWMRDYVTRCVDRGYCPGGIMRQAAAAITMGDFGPALQKLTLPCAIIHGRDDRMLKAEASFELGRLIPDSELHIYPGMGHEFPQPLWDEFADIIARTTRRAEA